MDEFGAALDGPLAEVADRVHATADALASLDDDHAVTRRRQRARRRHARDTRAEHEDVAHRASSGRGVAGGCVASVVRFTWRRMNPGAIACTT